MLPTRSAVVALLFVAVVPGVTARLDITQRPGDIWLEIPELHSRVEGNGSIVLDASPTGISHLVVHIAAQPQDARYGDIHTVINTEAADPITNKNSTDEGIVCDLDLTHWGQAFQIHPGRNSIEANYVDRRRRVHYASFLLQFGQQQTNRGTRSLPQTTRPAVPQRITGEKYAVVIGISKFKNSLAGIPNLKYADKDAAAFEHFLESPAGGSFPRENIKTLYDEEATSQSIRSALLTFLTKPRPQDLVVIYFAGHGAADPNDNRNLYLLAYDSDPDDMGGTAFPMVEFQEVFDRVVKARHVVTFIDACHSYGISGERASSKQNNLVNQYLERFASAADRAVITASDVSELSLEGTEWGGGHGVFTYYLLEGLEGKAGSSTVTAGQLFAYLAQEVPKATKGQQHPQAQPGLAKDLSISGAGLRAAAVERRFSAASGGQSR